MTQKTPILFPLREALQAHQLITFDDEFSCSKAGFIASRFPDVKAQLTRENLPCVSRAQMQNNFAFCREGRLFIQVKYQDDHLVLQRHDDGSATLLLEAASGKLHLYPLPLRASPEAFAPKGEIQASNEIIAIAEFLEHSPPAVWSDDNDPILPWIDAFNQSQEDLTWAHNLCDLVQMAGAALYPDWDEDDAYVYLKGSQVLGDGSLSQPSFLIVQESAGGDLEALSRQALTDLANEALLRHSSRITPKSSLCQEWDIMAVGDNEPELKASAILMSSLKSPDAFSSHQKIEALKTLRASPQHIS